MIDRYSREVTYDLTVGESFSIALENRGAAFPKLLINMLKTSELTVFKASQEPGLFITSTAICCDK